MLRSAVYATSLPMTVCDDHDERVRVDPETSPPYNWICYLDIAETNGNHWIGSGFKVHIPNMNCCIVVTSGHCVYVHGLYADNITVTFPGQAAVIATQADLYAPPEYRNDSNADYDYGIIILPGNSDEGFGWSVIVPDNELLGRIVTNCGYPGDKLPWPQMWITGGEITQVTANKLSYRNDTISGQSGSPVYTWYKGYWTAVGVHSHGTCPNSAPRFTSEMIHRFLERTQNLKKYAVRSVRYSDVYMRCDGTGVDANNNEGGVINCQYKPPSDWETFYIYPVEVTPSLATDEEQKYIVVVQNDHWQDTFVRLDGSGMTDTVPPGGGVVNCKWSGEPPGPQESFFLKQDQNDHYFFRSVGFPNCMIRLVGEGVNSHTEDGGGGVNCQYYDTGKGPGSCEQFSLEEQ